MKKLSFSILSAILVLTLSSCGDVKVTNSADKEAIPLRIVSQPSQTEHRKVINYQVIIEQFSSFGATVKKNIDNGWQPIEGVIAHPNGKELIQAMVKYDK